MTAEPTSPTPTAARRRFRWSFRSGLLALLGLILWSEWALHLVRNAQASPLTAVLLFVTLLPAMGLLVYRFRLVFDFFRSVHVGVTNLSLIGLGAICGVLFQQENPDAPVPEGAVEALAEAAANGDQAGWPREVRRAYGEYQDFRTAQAFFTYHLLNAMHLRGVMGFDDAPGDPAEIERSLENLRQRLPALRDRYGPEFTIAVERQSEVGLTTRAKNAEIRVLESKWEDLWFSTFVWADRLDLRRAYRSDWYSVLWGVLFLGVLSNTFRGGWRRLLKWQKWGFVVTHAGVMLVVLGGFHGRISERRGILELHIGESSGVFSLFKTAPDGSHTMRFSEPSLLFADGEPFEIRLDEFRADHHDVLDVIYAVRGENGALERKEFDLEDPKIRVFAGKSANFDWGQLGDERRAWMRLEVVDHAPKSRHRFELRAAQPGESAMPLARVSVTGADGVTRDRVIADLGLGDDVVFHDPPSGTKTRLRSVADRSEAEALLEEGRTPPAWGELRLPPRAIDEQPQVLAVSPGTRGSFRLDGRDYGIEVLQVLPDFHTLMDREAGRIAELPEPSRVLADLAAAELLITGPDGDEERRWVLQQDFPRDDLRFPELALLFRWSTWGGPADTRVELFATPDELLGGYAGDASSLRTVAAGTAFEIADGNRLVVDQAFVAGTAEDDFEAVESADFFDPLPPSVRIRATILDRAGPEAGWSERVEEFVLYAGFDKDHGQTRTVQYQGPDGQQRDVVLRFREDRDPGQLPVEWQSRLAVLRRGPGGQMERVGGGDIRVNDYLHVEGFRFFQSSHKPEDPTYSGIGVVYDPGIETVLSGLFMVMFGTMWVFLIQPVITRRHRGTD